MVHRSSQTIALISCVAAKHLRAGLAASRHAADGRCSAVCVGPKISRHVAANGPAVAVTSWPEPVGLADLDAVATASSPPVRD